MQPKAIMTHANSELSTVSNEPINNDTDEDHQLFFVTSYSNFDKLGKCLVGAVERGSPVFFLFGIGKFASLF
jgi:hypothetical protein